MISWALAYGCVQTNTPEALGFILITGIFDLIILVNIFNRK